MPNGSLLNFGSAAPTLARKDLDERATVIIEHSSFDWFASDQRIWEVFVRLASGVLKRHLDFYLVGEHFYHLFVYSLVTVMIHCRVSDVFWCSETLCHWTMV